MKAARAWLRAHGVEVGQNGVWPGSVPEGASFLRVRVRVPEDQVEQVMDINGLEGILAEPGVKAERDRFELVPLRDLKLGTAGVEEARTRASQLPLEWEASVALGRRGLAVRVLKDHAPDAAEMVLAPEELERWEERQSTSTFVVSGTERAFPRLLLRA